MVMFLIEDVVMNMNDDVNGQPIGLAIRSVR